LRALQSLDAITGLTRTGDELEISYEFPLYSFATVWQALCDQAGRAGLRLPQRFRQDAAAFMEGTERGHILARAGWAQYVQDIHVDCAQQTEQQRKQWQQHKPVKTSAN
jgi:hypothetical protein